MGFASITRRALGRLIRWGPLERVAVGLFSRIPADVVTRQQYFELFQSRGWHVTPVRWDQPVPDTRGLGDELWDRRSDLVGINLDVDGQLEFLEEICKRYRGEYDTFPDDPTGDPHQYYLNQHAFRSVDAEILYSMIREHRPQRIIEIGSGMSTLIAAAAVRKNNELSGQVCRFTAIEPHPPAFLRGGVSGLSELIEDRVESIPISVFRELGRNDILFIDSSHVVRIGGDVVYEFLEVLPRLGAGVLVHVHDVFLPADYPRKWVQDRHSFPSEQYLLQAFLAFNSRFEVLWAGSRIHLDHPERLESCFRSYSRDREWPGSFWIRSTD
jgi:predicted O-methyltransferase YrrM